ncbi:hydrophobic protein [Streptomyces sp. NPDC051569]|uniref:hydrophobic protein n=1 Tax=Streptomyces sp. NPDC051569 TaxID=3365661 RepID=UPI0037B4BD9B
MGALLLVLLLILIILGVGFVLHALWWLAVVVVVVWLVGFLVRRASGDSRRSRR